MNEPVADNPADWNRVAAAAMRLVREREPERTILIGSNRWNSVFTVHELDIPDTERTIITFHYYHPMPSRITGRRGAGRPHVRRTDPISRPSDRG